MKKKILCLLLCLFAFILTGCENKKDAPHPIVTMSIKDYGDIKIELLPEYAYNTVANFVNLVENGFYDNNIINRVQKGFVIQGGGLKDPGYTIKGEFAMNGYDNDLSHTKGVISMARTSEMNSASGQFFIVLDDSAKYSLDGSYAGFGKVIEGLDIIESIESTEFKFDNVNAPEGYGFLQKDEYITIEKATVETDGYNWEVKKY